MEIVPASTVEEVVKELEYVERELRRLTLGANDPTIKTLARAMKLLVRILKKAIAKK